MLRSDRQNRPIGIELGKSPRNPGSGNPKIFEAMRSPRAVRPFDECHSVSNRNLASSFDKINALTHGNALQTTPTRQTEACKLKLSQRLTRLTSIRIISRSLPVGRVPGVRDTRCPVSHPLLARTDL